MVGYAAPRIYRVKSFPSVGYRITRASDGNPGVTNAGTPHTVALVVRESPLYSAVGVAVLWAKGFWQCCGWLSRVGTTAGVSLGLLRVWLFWD